MTRRFSLPLCLLMSLLLVLASCSAAPTEAAPAPETVAPGAPLTVVDDAGRTLSLDAPASRIIVTWPSDAEILYALGAQEAIIAVGEECTYPDEIATKARVSTGMNISLEQLIALEPDLIVTGMMVQKEQDIDALAAAGIAVYVSAPQNIAGTYSAIEKLGVLTGRDAQAATIITDMKTQFAALAEKVAQLPQTRSAYVEVSPLQYGLWTTGGGTFMDELLGAAGIENAFGDIEGWAEISQEQVLTRNPDAILTTMLPMGDGDDPAAEIMARTGWDALSAVSSGRVTALPAMASLPGPRLAEAAQLLYSSVYGQ